MPLNDAGFKYFETNFLRPAYNEKKVPIQVHTAVTAFIMAALIVQLVKKVRQKAMWVHRWLGRLLLIVILAALYSSLLVHRQPNKIGRYAEYPDLLHPILRDQGGGDPQQADAGAPLSMIMLSSSLLLRGRPRHSARLSEFETLGPYLPLGPWKNCRRRYEQWLRHRPRRRSPLVAYQGLRYARQERQEGLNHERRGVSSRAITNGDPATPQTPYQNRHPVRTRAGRVKYRNSGRRRSASASSCSFIRATTAQSAPYVRLSSAHGSCGTGSRRS